MLLQPNDQSHLIVEDMQPLYYFNVKPALKAENMEHDDEQTAAAQEISMIKHKKAPSKAATPFFLGSPVN